MSAVPALSYHIKSLNIIFIALHIIIVSFVGTVARVVADPFTIPAHDVAPPAPAPAPAGRIGPQEERAFGRVGGAFPTRVE